ncbi:hypothetical protein ACLOAV_004920 [Pseudogymnoascus australis]
MNLWPSCLLLLAILFTIVGTVVSEPVQYCKYGSKTNDIDFCMGMLMHHNITSSSHDLYLSLSVTRPHSTALGWTSIGLGETMEGALMFIVYGDPLSSEKPIVSIRKSTGHKQPTLVTREDMNGADLRVSWADWIGSTSSPGSATLGASDSQGISVGNMVALLIHNPVLHLHGIIMGTALLLLFLIGILALRSGGSFKYHWIVQVVASAFTVIGFGLGLMLGRRINTVHQVVGISIASCLGVQGILGWRHHMEFIRIRRRTWLSHSHLWLGRAMIVGGWNNLITGMVLRGYSRFGITSMCILVGSETIGLTGWLWWIRVKAARAQRNGAPVILNESNTVGNKKSEADYFALGDDEYDDDGNSVDLQEDEEKPMMAKPGGG